MSIKNLIYACLLLLGFMPFMKVSADNIRIAVASNFILPMRSIVREFEKVTSHNVQMSYGSSGKFYAQIMNGAPYDIFLSADTSKPEKLEQADRIVTGSRFTYALGTLVLWTGNELLDVSGPEVISTAGINKIAIANPRFAPYGIAARQVFDALKLWPEVKSRLVMGENISQAYQFVDTGNAQLGLIALSQIKNRSQANLAKGWIIPRELHSPIQQQAVMIKTTEKNQQAVTSLMHYLQSAHSKQIIESYGYALPSG